MGSCHRCPCFHLSKEPLTVVKLSRVFPATHLTPFWWTCLLPALWKNETICVSVLHFILSVLLCCYSYSTGPGLHTGSRPSPVLIKEPFSLGWKKKHPPPKKTWMRTAAFKCHVLVLLKWEKIFTCKTHGGGNTIAEDEIYIRQEVLFMNRLAAGCCPARVSGLLCDRPKITTIVSLMTGHRVFM